MYRRYLGHVVAVGLNYFFGIDYNFGSHAALIVTAVLGLLKAFCGQALALFIDGMATVREDAINIKSIILSLKEKWERSGVYTTLSEQIRLFKDGLPHGLLNGE